MATLSLFVAIICLSQACGNVNVLFDGFKKQELPLRYCGGSNLNGVLRKLPALPVCRPVDTKKNSSAIILTSYSTDKSEQIISATECYIRSYTYYVPPTLVGIKRALLLIQDEKYEPLTAGACQDLVLTKTTPDNQKLEDHGEGAIGTKNNKVPSPKWFTPAEITNTNYYVTKIWLNANDNYIKPIGVAITQECTVEDEQCPTSRGILIWDKTDHKTCRLIQGKPTPCLRTGKSLIIPCSS